MPRCKNPNCKDKFVAKFFLQKFCAEKVECIAMEIELKKATIWKEKRTEWKEDLKTHSDWLKVLQAVFNTYIRVRDKNKPCVSCDKPAGQYTLTAGHFWTAGNYSFLRFNEDNVHGQCWFNCNKNKHGNVGEYRIRLAERIGDERLKFLDDNREKELKLSIPEIKELITHYKQKIKQAA